MPLKRDGVVIFITDGAKGFAREAALELSDSKYGFHVLVGVKSEAELKSFAYESKKGLEPIIFDIADPTTLVNIVYRLRTIKKSLYRDLGGIIINLADFMIDHMEEKSKHQVVDTNYLDSHHKGLLKGPTRLLEAVFDWIRHERSEKEKEQAEASNIAYTDKEESWRDGDVLDLGAMRVAVVTGQYSDENAYCDSKCIMQDACSDFMYQVAGEPSLSNWTLSTVETTVQSIAPEGVCSTRNESARRKKSGTAKAKGRERRTKAKRDLDDNDSLLMQRYKQIEAYLQRKWRDEGHSNYVEDYGSGKSGEKWKNGMTAGQRSFIVRSLLHFFSSHHPLEHYTYNSNS